jgi:hypothetical protein
LKNRRRGILSSKCPHCRARIGQLATTCWKCKSPLKEPDGTPEGLYQYARGGSEDIGRSRIYHTEKGRSLKKIGTIIVILSIIFLVFFAYYAYIQESKGRIGKFGEDYWFEVRENGEEVLKTNDGWTFELNILQNYTLEGIILGTNHYFVNDKPYNPCNIFSPVDICVGIDDVADNVENYDFTIISFENRFVRWYLQYDDREQYDYFKAHTGNNHLIPHNSLVFSSILDLKENDMFTLKGYIVSPYGTRGTSWVEWPSDNKIGNAHCEVILVDEIAVW